MKFNQSDVEKQLISTTQQLLSESGTEYNQRQITLDSSLHRHLGIDSIGRAELFQRIEKTFDIQLPTALMGEAETLNDVLNGICNASSPNEKIVKNIQAHLEKSHISPIHAKTLVDVLLLYATGDPNRPHIYLQDENGKEEIITYGKLLDKSLIVADQLLKKGLLPGDTIAIMQPTNPGFFYSFFGALLINCIPVPIYPPFRPHQIEAYAKQEAKILQNAEVRLLITFQEAENLSKLLRAFIPSLKEITTINALLNASQKAPIFGATASDPAMIQYTSGSTSSPKGVLLTHHNLLANIRAYGEAIRINHHDVAVSWAPLYHDLGLIGMWLGSLYHGIPLTLMSPLTFLNRPERWLWAIHYHRGTISGGPNFAYELCIRKIEPPMIEGLDLSSWRIAFNGAEAIQPKTLERFTEKFAPYGFRHETHLPVYGLAESSVCVAISPLDRVPRIDIIERQALEEKSQAIQTTREEQSLKIVACGIAIPGHDVRIVDKNNQPLPDREVGQLQFKGPSSMQGYYNNPTATSTIYHEGWWDTGDLAYLAEGEIFITGRKKDIIIKAGRNLYPAEIEELVGQIKEIRTGCVIAFGVTDAKRGTEKLILVAETRNKKTPDPQQIIDDVNDAIFNTLDITADEVVLVPPQTIPKTSSGKLQRAACKASYQAGTLTRHRIPFWLQMTKMGMKFGFAKIQRQFSTLGKCIYTLYVYLILAITLTPTYLSLWIFPRSIIAIVCKYWSRIFFLLIFCPTKLVGKRYLKQKQPVIYAANHASYIDGVFLLGLLPSGTLFIGKQELAKTPIVRTFMRKLQFITVDRNDLPKGLEDTKLMEETLRMGHSIAIFPEGTFSYAIGLRPFKLGAFKIAAETETPICPIAIKGSRQILRGEERLLKPGPLTVTLNPLVTPIGKTWQDITELKNQIRSIIAKDCGEHSLDLITSTVAEH